jgi:hypothetical protein
MKKLLFIGTIMLAIASCSGNAKEGTKENTIEEVKNGTLINRGDKNTALYYMILEAEDGDKTKKKVEIIIDKLIVIELKLSEDQIRNMCEDAIRYANWNSNFKLTYKYTGTPMLSYDKNEKIITAYMTGTAENAYGVADNVNTIIRFDLKGKMIMNKDGLPDIL